MAHVREQLRQAVYDTLIAYADLTNIVAVENISVERVDLFQQKDIHGDASDQFPAINIIANDDLTDNGFINACGKYDVEQEVQVEVYVNREDNYGSAIDWIVVQVQRALFANLKLGLPITGVKYANSRMSRDLSELR